MGNGCTTAGVVPVVAEAPKQWKSEPREKGWTMVTRTDEKHRKPNKKHPVHQSGYRKHLKDEVRIGIKRPYPGAWVTINVFVSSTFRDMHTERDRITRIIFPKLNKKFQSRRIRLVPTDLRWGLTIEDTSDTGKGALELCLDEIDRSRGWFIVLLGARYGWVPSEYKISNQARYDWVHEVPPGKSITEMEILHGVLNSDDRAVHAMAFSRDPTFLKDVPSESKGVFMEVEFKSKEKLRMMREAIYDHPMCQYVLNYPCEYIGEDSSNDGKLMLTGLEQFEKDVYDLVEAAVLKEFPEEMMVDHPDAEYMQEKIAHEETRNSLIRPFFGREERIDNIIRTYVCDATCRAPFVVHGRPGSGKSAMLAAIAEQVDAELEDIDVITFFVGATPSSSNIVNALSYLCTALAKLLAEQQDLPRDYFSLRTLLRELLSQCSKTNLKAPKTGRNRKTKNGTRKTLIIFDGLSQLDPHVHNAHSLYWLPTTLPRNIRFIVSTSSDRMDRLRNREPKPPERDVNDLKEGLSKDIVRAYLGDYRKKLDESVANDQMSALLQKKERGKPLFLETACEEIRVFGVFEKVKDFIKELPHTIEELYQFTLRRLSLDHPPGLVKRAVCYFAVARAGLTEGELRLLLSVDPAQHGYGSAPVPSEPLPLAVWERLFASFRPYLHFGDGDGPMAFRHTQLRIAAQELYLLPCPEGAACANFLAGVYCDHLSAGRDVKNWTKRNGLYHRRLADYFLSIADPRGDRSWAPTSDDDPFNERKRAMSELLYHATHARMWDLVHFCLTDIHFILNKCACGLAFGLVVDYGQACRMLNFRITKIRYVSDRLARKGYIPKAVRSEMQGPSQEAENGKVDKFNLAERMRADRLAQYLMEILEFFTFVHNKANLLNQHPDWAFQEAANLPHAATPAVSAYAIFEKGNAPGPWLRRMTKVAGKQPNELTLPTGKSATLTGCVCSRSGRYLLSVDVDGTVRLWDKTTGEVLNDVAPLMEQIVGVPGGYPRMVHYCCCFSPNERKFATGGKYLRPMEKKKASAKSANAVKPREDDFQNYVGLLIVRATVSFQVTYKHEFESGPVKSVAMSNDGKHLAVDRATPPFRITLFNEDTPTGAWIVQHEVQRDSDKNSDTIKLQFDNKGVYLFGASTSGLIIAREVASGEEVKVFKRNCAALCIDVRTKPRMMAVGGEDDNIFLWNLTATDPQQWPDEPVMILKGHNNEVNAVAFAPTKRPFRLFSTSKDDRLRVWDLKEGKAVASFHGNLMADLYAHFSPKAFVTAGAAGMKVWDGELLLNETVVSSTPLEQDGSVMDLSFSLDCKLCAAATGDVVEPNRDPQPSRNTIGIWDTTAIDNVAKFELSGHRAAVTCCVFSPVSPQELVSASMDGTVRVWDAESREHYVLANEGAEQHVYKVMYSPCGKYLFTITSPSAKSTFPGGFEHRWFFDEETEPSTVAMWVLNGGEKEGRKPHWKLGSHRPFVTHMAVSSDSAWLVVAAERYIYLYCLLTGKCKAKQQGGGGTLEGYLHPVTCAFAPWNSSFLAVGFGMHGVILYQISDDGFEHVWGTIKFGQHITFDSLGHTLAVCGSRQPKPTIYTITTSPNGETITGVTEGAKLRVGVKLRSPQSLSFVGRFLILVCVNQESQMETRVTVWDCDSGECRCSLAFTERIPWTLQSGPCSMVIGGGDIEGRVTILRVEGCSFLEEVVHRVCAIKRMVPEAKALVLSERVTVQCPVCGLIDDAPDVPEDMHYFSPHDIPAIVDPLVEDLEPDNVESSHVSVTCECGTIFRVGRYCANSLQLIGKENVPAEPVPAS